MNGKFFARQLDIAHLDDMDDDAFVSKSETIRPQRPSDFRGPTHNKRDAKRDQRKFRAANKYGESED